MGKAAVIWAALGIVASSAVSGLVWAEDHAGSGERVDKTTIPVAECARFSGERREEKTIDYRLENTCSAGLACNVSWVVTCDGTAIRVGDSASLAPGAGKTFKASAVRCEGDWRIGDAQWTCRANTN